MHKKQERQRLNELFSGIELLDFNPAARISEIRHEPENLPSRIADLEKPILEYENGVVDIEANLSANPQVGQEHSDGLSLYEQDQMEYAYSNDNLETLFDSTSSLSNIPNTITLPLKAGGQSIGETQIVPQPDRQLTDDGLSVTDGQAVGIGTVTGIMVTGLVLAFTSQVDLFNNLGRLALAGFEVLCGIMGALAAQSSKKTRRAIWIGSLEWSLVPVLVVSFFIFLLSLLMFTSFFGV